MNSPHFFRCPHKQIKKEPGTTRLDYQHFLHGYNPQTAPHQLEGPATIRGYENKPPLSTALAMPPTNQKSDTAGEFMFALHVPMGVL